MPVSAASPSLEPQAAHKTAFRVDSVSHKECWTAGHTSGRRPSATSSLRTGVDGLASDDELTASCGGTDAASGFSVCGSADTWARSGARSAELRSLVDDAGRTRLSSLRARWQPASPGRYTSTASNSAPSVQSYGDPLLSSTGRMNFHASPASEDSEDHAGDPVEELEAAVDAIDALLASAGRPAQDCTKLTASLKAALQLRPAFACSRSLGARLRCPTGSGSRGFGRALAEAWSRQPGAAADWLFEADTVNQLAAARLAGLLAHAQQLASDPAAWTAAQVLGAPAGRRMTSAPAASAALGPGRRWSPAGESPAAGAGRPADRLCLLREKLLHAHGSLSLAFDLMDVDRTGFVSFQSFHAHLVRLQLCHVDANSSLRALELFKLLDRDGDDLLSPRDCLQSFELAAHERACELDGSSRRTLDCDRFSRDALGVTGDVMLRAAHFRRYLVGTVGSLAKALRLMDGKGRGFVDLEVFVESVVHRGYCTTLDEAEPLFRSLDVAGHGRLDIQHLALLEDRGAFGPTRRAASMPPPLAEGVRRVLACTEANFFRSEVSEAMQSGGLFSDPGCLDDPRPAVPSCTWGHARARTKSRSCTRRSSASASDDQPVHERLYAAQLRHWRGARRRAGIACAAESPSLSSSLSVAARELSASSRPCSLISAARRWSRTLSASPASAPASAGPSPPPSPRAAAGASQRAASVPAAPWGSLLSAAAGGADAMLRALASTAAAAVAAAALPQGGDDAPGGLAGSRDGESIIGLDCLASTSTASLLAVATVGPCAASWGAAAVACELQPRAAPRWRYWAIEKGQSARITGSSSASCISTATPPTLTPRSVSSGSQLSAGPLEDGCGAGVPVVAPEELQPPSSPASGCTTPPVTPKALSAMLAAAAAAAAEVASRGSAASGADGLGGVRSWATPGAARARARRAARCAAAASEPPRVVMASALQTAAAMPDVVVAAAPPAAAVAAAAAAPACRPGIVGINLPGPDAAAGAGPDAVAGAHRWERRRSSSRSDSFR